jgi:hypothetical protein
MGNSRGAGPAQRARGRWKRARRHPEPTSRSRPAERLPPVGRDVCARYSARVWFRTLEAAAVRLRQTEVVPRKIPPSAILWQGAFFIPL